MGRLTEALLARQQALDQHEQKRPEHPYEEDPVGGHMWYRRRIDLEYLRAEAGKELGAAVTALTPEQRQQFFLQILSERYLGPTVLTTAYMQAVRQAEGPQAQPLGEVAQITEEQKKEFWRNREFPIQGIGAAN